MPSPSERLDRSPDLPFQQLNELTATLCDRRVLLRSELAAAVDLYVDWLRADLVSRHLHDVAWLQHASSGSRFPPLRGFRDGWIQSADWYSSDVADVGTMLADVNAPTTRERIEQWMLIWLAHDIPMIPTTDGLFTDGDYAEMLAFAERSLGGDWRSQLPHVVEG